MKFKPALPAIALALCSCRLTLIAVILSALALFASHSAEAGTVYIGNSLTVPNGGADGDPPLVILGEYSPAGPLATASSATTLPNGTVQDVKFYGSDYNFTLYALSLVASDPSLNQQTFQVVASESFSGFALPGIQTLAVSGFSVTAGDFLAFAGIGPYYPQNPNDAPNSDATYEDSSDPGSFRATPPGGPGTEFTVGPYPDPGANYEFISDYFGNEGRTYGIGVDVSLGCITIDCPNDIVLTTSSNSLAVAFSVNASDSCSTNFSLISEPPSGTEFALGTTTVTSTVTDSLGNTNSCSFTVTVLAPQPPTLFSFADTNGSNPNGLVLAADGTLFGTTQFGGTNDNSGTVFSMSPDGVVTTLHCFNTTEGGNPQTGLVQRQYDGDLYGTTRSGSPTAFRVMTNGALTTLLPLGGTNGSNPNTLIEGSDGNFYGTTQFGAYDSGWGSVFQLTFNGRFTTLYSFADGDDGAYPQAALVEGSDGDFYGTTSEGGTNNAGTVFRITAGGALTNLYSFTGGDDGYLPLGALIQGRDGDFYGTTSYGGTYNTEGEGYGTVFKISSGGTLTTLASFAGPNGAYPQAGLVQGADGFFYGTTSQGGASLGDPNSLNGEGYGTAFRIDASGALTLLVSFNGTNGAYPQTTLVQSSDGSLYGTTSQGGIYSVLGAAYNYGTVFQINPAALPSAKVSGTNPAALPPFLMSLARAGATVELTWNANVGRGYQLQFKPSLLVTNWTNLGSVVTATNDALTLTDPMIPGTGQRFYRVVLVP
jgi:uncharacterized repeat protein (TIGR03803 family)